MFHKICVIFFMCCVVVSQCDKKNDFPGYDYYPETNGWLKVHSEPATWLEARVTCHLEESYLAADWSEIKQTILDLQKNTSLGDIYAGAKVNMEITGEGEYKYLTGEPQLNEGARGLYSLKPCIVLSANGSVSEVNCNQKLPFVCYSPERACGLPSDGYEFSNVTGHCYKLYTDATTWLRALAACGKEGAYLAVINSKNEADILKQLFARYPTEALKNYDLNSVVAIGFYYWKPSNSWWTIKGQSINEAGFDSWQRNEPSLPSSRMHAGYMHREGKLYSHLPSYKVAYFCEKNPITFDTYISEDLFSVR